MTDKKSIFNTRKPVNKTGGGKEKMKRCIKKNNEAQVLGLPMYLIIIMIVAVAVIAAVLMMLPQGTKMMDAQVIEGSVHSGDGSVGDLDITVGTIQVKVTTDDDRRDPIEGAVVRLSGAHGIGESDPTGTDGIATISVTGCMLDSGVNEASMKMTVKASGFEDFEDLNAVTIYRG